MMLYYSRKLEPHSTFYKKDGIYILVILTKKNKCYLKNHLNIDAFNVTEELIVLCK